MHPGGVVTGDRCRHRASLLLCAIESVVVGDLIDQPVQFPPECFGRQRHSQLSEIVITREQRRTLVVVEPTRGCGDGVGVFDTDPARTQRLVQLRCFPECFGAVVRSFRRFGVMWSPCGPTHPTRALTGRPRAVRRGGAPTRLPGGPWCRGRPTRRAGRRWFRRRTASRYHAFPVVPDEPPLSWRQ